MKAPASLLPILLLLISLLMLSGCTSGSPVASPQNTPGRIDGPMPSESESSLPPVEENTSIPIPDPIEAILSNMTLEEKVGQLFFVAYRQNTDGAGVLAMDETLEKLLEKFHPGGFALFSENLDTIDQTVSFIQDLQSVSAIPLFVSLDEEGGIVTRLNKAPNMHATDMPANFTIGLTKQSEYAYLAAKTIADEIKSLGFNMDFAPVADIFSNPDNKVIGKRSYGNDAASVSPMVYQAVKGFQDSFVIPVLKHFPGHGDTLEDSHTGAATVQHDLKRLEASELIPFKDGMAAGAEVIMTAHILLPNATEQAVPATLSREIVTDLLREKMGFRGVVMTDALEMSAISAFYSEEEAVVKALEAGVDMLLMPSDLEKAFTAVLKAVSNGTLSESRINESLIRILTLKQKYRILSGGAERPDPYATLGSEEHLKLADEIRKEAQSK